MSEDVVSVPIQDLLHCLVCCSEKAACIARAFRKEDNLFGLLVEEKSVKEINLTLVKDFKTLADVIIQETIKRDVGIKFPVLASQIFGEEQNVFQNTLGEQIKVELTNSQLETSALLCKVLDGKKSIAESLAEIIHSQNDTVMDHSSTSVIPINNLGIWIDPIDSTGEYIQAKRVESDEYGFDLKGLKSVCVLIGVYSMNTGLPVVGIINQPFYKDCFTKNRWESCIYWGINYGDQVKTSTILFSPSQRQKVIVTSSFESEQLLSILKAKYSVAHPAGSGYKSLLVAQQMATLYVLSLDSTHFWDTCGPQAILAALGGGIVSFDAVLLSAENLSHSNIHKFQLTCSKGTKDAFKNSGGLIAYSVEEDLLEFVQWLRDSGYKRDELKE